MESPIKCYEWNKIKKVKSHTKGIWSISASFSWSMSQFTASSTVILPAPLRKIHVNKIYRYVQNSSRRRHQTNIIFYLENKLSEKSKIHIFWTNIVNASDLVYKTSPERWSAQTARARGNPNDSSSPSNFIFTSITGISVV